MKRLTTRSRATAGAIRDCEDFTTSGSLRGVTVMQPNRLGRWDSGQLSGTDLAWFYNDLPLIDYVVWSYSTPVAWHMTAADGTGTWHRVGQSFSPTTSKHQGNLYLIERTDHEVQLLKSDKGWSVWCYTCAAEVSDHNYKKDASQAAHMHRIAGRVGIMPSGYERVS